MGKFAHERVVWFMAGVVFHFMIMRYLRTTTQLRNEIVVASSQTNQRDSPEDQRRDTRPVSNKRSSLPRKVYHFLKEAGYGIGNMQAPQFFDDVDEQRGRLIIDVGACDGSEWAVPAAKKRGHTVLAFEPMPANRERFMDTVRNNRMQGQTETVNVSGLGI